MALGFTVILDDDTMKKIVEYMGYDPADVSDKLADEDFCDRLSDAFAETISSRLVDEPHYAAEDVLSVDSGLTPE